MTHAYRVSVWMITFFCFSIAATPYSRAATSDAKSDTDAGASSELQEITVTAARRETRLNDTPISLEVFTPQRLDAQGVRDIDDLTRLAPSVTFQRVGATGIGNLNDEESDIAIRGIDSSAGSSTTGVYIDDVPIHTRHLSFGTVNAFPELFDLERVEILRGPQGTLFGASSEGGAIRFIQPEPSLTETSGSYRAEWGQTERGGASFNLGAAAGVPLVDGLVGLRVSASSRQDGGYVDRVAYSTDPLEPTAKLDPNANTQQSWTFRTALKIAATDDFTISPSVYYQRLRVDDTSVYWRSLSNQDTGAFRNGNAQADSALDPFTLAELKLDWNLSAVRLTSTSSYFARNQSSISDNTQYNRTAFLGNPYPPPGQYGTAYFTDAQHNFIEEVKAVSTSQDSPLQWVAGLYYAHLSENTLEQIYDPTLAEEVGFDNPPPGPNGLIYNQNPFRAIDDQVALYGQADYKLLPSWTLTLGVRVASLKTKGEEFYSGPFVGATPASANGSETDHPVTPKVGISYQPTRDNLLYASAAKGYRAGGINAGLGTTCDANLATIGLTAVPPSYKPDSLWSYEVGAKNTLLDGTLQVNTSVYYIKWKNIQQNVYLPGCGLEFSDNLGDAISKGFEFSSQYKVTSHLLVSVDVAYVDAYYNSTVRAGSPTAGLPVVSEGDKLSITPWNINLASQYDFDELYHAVPYIRADFQLMTAQTGFTPTEDPANGSADLTIPGRPESKNLSMRAGARFNSIDVSAYVNNLTNNLPVLLTARDSLTSPNYFERSQRPRTIGVTATYRF